jgi:hypothetical protein
MLLDEKTQKNELKFPETALEVDTSLSPERAPWGLLAQAIRVRSSEEELK